MSYILSKSKYIRGLQCDRALWLDVFNPKEARYSPETLRAFDHGRDFEAEFKATFPTGMDISDELKKNRYQYPVLTSDMLDREGEVVLFEAGFLYDGILVLADVTCKHPDGSLDIYEVKSGSHLTDTYRNDAAIQHYVISHCRWVRSFNVVHNGNPPGATPDEQTDTDANTNTRFAVVNLTDELAARHDEIAQNVAKMKEILQHGEPATPTGQHCLSPYACPYQQHCAKGVRQLQMF